MSVTATVRVMSAEEIAASGGGATPFLQFPARAGVFAERAMRLQQRAAAHPMGDYLRFAAEIALAQHRLLAAMPALSLALPSPAQLDAAAQEGSPPLQAATWPRDPAWHGVLHTIARALQPRAPATAQQVLQSLLHADADRLEQQAEALLIGSTHGVDLAQAPLIAAALQVCWTHMLLQLADQPSALGRIDDALACPCCGSRPVASIARSGAGFNGQRYLQCSLCSLQWHLPRTQCSHCGSTRSLAYESLDSAEASDDEAGSRAARAAVQAETCDDCNHYLKLLHAERDPFVEPVADDLATLTLDLLVSDSGRIRHGVNFMLLFGPADAPPDPGGD